MTDGGSPVARVEVIFLISSVNGTRPPPPEITDAERPGDDQLSTVWSDGHDRRFRRHDLNDGQDAGETNGIATTVSTMSRPHP